LHPDNDIPALLEKIDGCNKIAGKVWDPLTKSEQFWINRNKVQSMYGRKTSSIVMIVISIAIVFIMYYFVKIP
jgi:hypothetical protein